MNPDYYFDALLHPHPLFVFNLYTLIGYLLATCCLFLPARYLTRNLKNGQTLVRSMVAAIAFVPGIIIDPGVSFLALVPAPLAGIYWLLVGEIDLGRDFALVPLVMVAPFVWIILCGVGIVRQGTASRTDGIEGEQEVASEVAE